MRETVKPFAGRKVAVIDDHDVVRRGLCLLLQSQFGFQVVEGSNAWDALHWGKDESVDLVLLDVRLGEKDGIWALGQLREVRPKLPIIMLSTYPSPDYVQAAIDGRANGYLLKEASIGQLQEAITTALSSGDLYLHPGVTQALIKRQTQTTHYAELLSDREMAVLELVSEGATNDEIAGTIHVSEKTVKSHLSSIFRKLEVSNRTQAAAKALREGIVSGSLVGR